MKAVFNGGGNYNEAERTAASILFNHFAEAQNFVAKDNANPFWKQPALDNFTRLFVDEQNPAKGISLKDLRSMDAILDAQYTKKLLDDMRHKEVVSGVASGIAAGVHLTLGGVLGYFGWRELSSGDVPKFSTYINSRRSMLESWTAAK